MKDLIKIAIPAALSAILSGTGFTLHYEAQEQEIVSASRYVAESMAQTMTGHAESRCKALNEFSSQLFDDLYRLEEQ